MSGSIPSVDLVPLNVRNAGMARSSFLLVTVLLILSVPRGSRAAEGPSAAPPGTTKLQQVPLRRGAIREGSDMPFRRGGEPRAADLSVEVKRIWKEAGATFASVTVRNISAYDLDEIDLTCAAVDAEGKQLGFHQETLRGSDADPLKPGAARTVKLQVDGDGKSLRSLSCTADGF